MSSFEDLLDNIGLLVGGTKLAEPPPGFFSGYRANDGTGVAGLNGCYSRPPRAISEPPVGILIPHSFSAQLNAQGYEESTDTIRLLVICKTVDIATDLNILEPFRDTIPAIFRTHMQNDTVIGAIPLTPEPLFVWCSAGTLGDIAWQGDVYPGWSFDLKVLRETQVIYAR